MYVLEQIRSFCIVENKIQLLQDLFWTPTWRLFPCKNSNIADVTLCENTLKQAFIT